MIKGNLPAKLLVGYVVLSMVLFADMALAASTGASPLPAGMSLQTIRDFFTGTFAWSVSVIAIVVAGSTLAFGGDFGGVARTFLILAVVLAFAVFANNTMMSWFSGALIA